MAMATRGAVLAYAYPSVTCSAASWRGAVEQLLDRHGLALRRAVAPTSGQVVVQLVERATGQAPAVIPDAVAMQLEIWADERDERRVAGA
jgi:hypothetical protein